MPRAARRNATRQRPDQVVSTSAVESSATILDMDNPLNWTVAQLRERLTQLGIQVPKGFNASTLRQLYNENINKGDVTERRENSHEGSLGGSDATNNGVPLQTLGETESTVTNTNNDGVLLQTLQSMAQSCAALQQTVNTLLAKENKKDAEKEDDNPLKKYAAQVHTDSASVGEVQAGGSSSREESDGLPTGIRSNLELGQVVQKLMNNSVTERTRLTYKQGFKTYKHFLTIHGVFYDAKCPPISEDILVHFVAYCQHNLLLKFSTIRLYLCGIRNMFLEMGIPNPFQSKCHSMERLKLILNAIRKVQSKDQIKNKVRLPITAHILQRICTVLRNCMFKYYTNVLLEAMYVTAFFGFFRCGELTIQQKFDPCCHLCCEDVQIHEDCVKIFLKTSKTDHFHKGSSIVLYSNDTKVCPVKSMCKYMQVRKFCFAGPKEALFVTEDNLPVTRSYFIEHLQYILKVLGFDSEKYSGHSFRIGAATSAASARMEDHLIKTLGRWSSDCYNRYIRTPTNVVRDAQISMATSFHSENMS